MSENRPIVHFETRDEGANTLVILLILHMRTRLLHFTNHHPLAISLRYTYNSFITRTLLSSKTQHFLRTVGSAEIATAERHSGLCFVHGASFSRHLRVDLDD